MKCVYFCLSLINLLWDDKDIQIGIGNIVDWDAVCSLIKSTLDNKDIKDAELYEVLDCCLTFHTNLLKNNREAFEPVAISEKYFELFKPGIL